MATLNIVDRYIAPDIWGAVLSTRLGRRLFPEEAFLRALDTPKPKTHYRTTSTGPG